MRESTNSIGRRLSAPGGTIRWDGFALDLECGELYDAAGGRVELRPHSLDVLRCLAANAGRLVTKDALMAEVWPDVTVSEDSLTQCISEIRKAIGDDGHDLIRNVPRKGYIFGARLTPTVSGGAAESESSRWLRMSDRPSIAVLAFDSFCGDSDQSMLGEGLAEDITTELARNRDLTVLARNTSFSVKGQCKSCEEIARDFKVRYLLEGSVRRADDRLIVNAQLVDGRDSSHVWAQRYEFGAREIYRSQSDLCARIAGTLLAEMRQTEKSASLRRPPANLDVYELTWRGIAHKHQFTKEGHFLARAELERAIALDPNYAPAHIYLGYLKIVDIGIGVTGAASQAEMPAAIGQVQHGVSLDPWLAVGYQALGLAFGFAGEFEAQMGAAERSVELGPGDAENIAFLSYALINAGRYGEALAAVERAMYLNPRTPPYYLGFHAIALYALDRFDEAARSQTLCAQLTPAFAPAYTIGAASDIAMGRKGKARERIAKLLQIHPDFTTETPIIVNAFPSDPDLRARQIAQLREAGLP